MKIKNKGYSLVEVMIAVALLAIVMTFVTSYIFNQTKATIKVSNQAECSGAAQSLIDRISSLGTRDNVLPAYLGAIGGEDAFYNTAAGQQLAQFFSRLPSSVTSTYWGDPASTTWRAVIGNDSLVTNSHLVLSSTSVVESLYNTDPAGYCAGTKDMPAELMGGTPSTLNNVQVKMKIQPSNFSDTPVAGACTTPLRAAPKGTSNAALKYPLFGGNPDLQYKVEITVRYTSADGPAACSSSNTYSHSLDQVNNSLPTVSNGIAIGGVYNTLSTPHTLCDSQQIAFDIDVAGLEGGSVPLCKGDVTFPAVINTAWVSCADLTFPGQTGLTTITPSSLTSFRIQFAGLVSERIYRFSVGSVDTAGNLTATVAVKDFIVDMQRPSISNVVPQPPIAIGTNPFQSAYYQCDESADTFDGVYTGDPITQNWQPCQVNVTPAIPTTVTFASPNCQATADPTNSNVNTQYSLRLEAYDICNVTAPPGVQSPARTWWTLPQPIGIRVVNSASPFIPYPIVLAPDVGQPGGFVIARCDGLAAPRGGASGNWTCSVTGQNQGNCTGKIAVYGYEDVCGRANVLLDSWSATNACYPFYADGCGTRTETDTSIAPSPPNLCSRVPGYFEEVDCKDACDPKAFTPQECRPYLPASCAAATCYQCRDMCPAGHFYNGAPDCLNSCANNQRCSVSPPTNLGDPNCKWCNPVCNPGDYITNNCTNQYTGAPGCAGNQTCRQRSPGCYYCENNCPGGMFNDSDQPNCGDTCFGAQSCNAQTPSYCRMCECPSGQTTNNTCGGCGPQKTCNPAGGGCYQCQCIHSDNTCDGACASGEVCRLASGTGGCYRCTTPSTPPPAPTPTGSPSACFPSGAEVGKSACFFECTGSGVGWSDGSCLTVNGIGTECSIHQAGGGTCNPPNPSSNPCCSGLSPIGRRINGDCSGWVSERQRSRDDIWTWLKSILDIYPKATASCTPGDTLGCYTWVWECG